MPPVPIKQILFQGFENTRGIWEIAEFQIFGVGFAPFAHYVSNVIDLGEPASLGQLTWLGEKGEQDRIDLSMRSGDDNDPNSTPLNIDFDCDGIINIEDCDLIIGNDDDCDGDRDGNGDGDGDSDGKIDECIKHPHTPESVTPK